MRDSTVEEKSELPTKPKGLSLSIGKPGRRKVVPQTRRSDLFGAAEVADNQPRKTAVTSLADIGQDEGPLVIECRSRLPAPAAAAAPRKPRLVYDPAKEGRLEWERSEVELSKEGALAPAVRQLQKRNSGAKPLLKSIDTVEIGEPTKYEVAPAEFGLAMLRGMGFNAEEDEVPVTVQKRRTFGMAGIGADYRPEAAIPAIKKPE